ncbi:NAD-dependent epimerase/dehydratase family protein [Altericroceibacterium xinjiangense]|uniref:NAD-dependent epimerase/dehydratase family protein n=1 Tax=Altericroceibacterium xinjiangense TaxID=762261 RepID=UPI0013E0537D|nr:NAD-dependent epimerase/dehydratase family protein [Altericroceibacterium xinjiangense]
MYGTRLPLLVIGGNSAIGRHILELLPDARAIARDGGGGHVSAVGSYFDLAPDAFAGVHTVINCAGLVQGGEDELRRVNCDLQQELAEKARAAGVARYVAIGSFSIFGAREQITAGLQPDPIDAYGRSKLEGERRLAAAQGEGFGVLSVAFPAIIGTSRPGKVERMLHIWRRTRVWPMPAGDVQRSMIGAKAAARVLVAAGSSDRTGRVLAADPVPFTYRSAAQWMREDLGARVGLARVPGAVEALFAASAPGLHRSLMADSMLRPDDNFMSTQRLESSLRPELVASAKRKSAL